MKDLNGIDRRDDLNVMDPFEALFTGIVTEDVTGNDKNIIFKFTVSDGSYFYPVTHTCENVLTTGEMDFLRFCVFFVDNNDECNYSVDLNDFVGCECYVYLFSTNNGFAVRYAATEWRDEDDEQEETIFDNVQFENNIVPDEVNILFRELLAQYELSEVLNAKKEKSDHYDKMSLSDMIDLEMFLSEFDDIELP